MKRSDIGLIIAVVIVAGFMSLITSRILFSPKKTQNLSAQKVEAIKAEFSPPDEKFFNNDSINPTQLIKIGDTENTKPF